jgi:hypothetical protein
MFKIKNSVIHCTRGDKGTIQLKVPTGPDTFYTFHPGDEIIFTVKTTFGVPTPNLRKVTQVMEPTEAVNIELTREDTTWGDLISEAVVYQYDVSLNGDETLIGYDEKGYKEFILYPEGGENE